MIYQVTDKFKIHVDNDIEKYRAESFWTKEPETIEWINTFRPINVFYDVGVNIGLYSLYAASLYPEMTIVAYEPMRKNFIRLMQNIELNRFDNIIALPFAVSDGNYAMRFNDLNGDYGQSGGQVGNKGYLVTAVSLVSVMCDYLKIDIDGQEDKVIKGIQNFNILKSCLIEVDPKNRQYIVDRFIKEGFELDAGFDSMPIHSKHRRKAEGINVENLIFKRRTI